MNILLYMPYLNQSGGGAKQYSVALVKTLSEDKLNKYYILNYDGSLELKNIVEASMNLSIIPQFIAKEYFIEIIALFLVKSYNLILNYLQIKFKPLNFSFLSRICFQYGIEIVHCPYQYAPYSQAVTIWTLHDVQELHFPHYFTPIQREQRARTWNDNFNRADHVIVSFDHVQNDIFKFFSNTDVSVAFIDLKYLWISKYILENGKYEENNSSYLIYAANTWQHKNHLGLIRAIKYIKDKYNKDISIVFVGHKNDYINVLNEEIKMLKIENLITFKGVVSDPELYSLYKGARLSVIPSIYEAGSFPLFESLLLGIPTLCSSVTSLPSTIGNDSFVFDPFNVPQIGELIYDAFNEGDFRQKCFLNSVSQGNKLLQIENLTLFTNIYRELLHPSN